MGDENAKAYLTVAGSMDDITWAVDDTTVSLDDTKVVIDDTTVAIEMLQVPLMMLRYHTGGMRDESREAEAESTKAAVCDESVKIVADPILSFH